MSEYVDIIWSKLIIPSFLNIQRTLGDVVCPESDKEVFSRHLEEIIAHTNAQYMSGDVVRLSRHKNAAAVMIAILKTKPIKKVSPVFYQADKTGKTTSWPLNESLAITVALSLLRTYIMERYKAAFENNTPVNMDEFEGVTKQDREIFGDGIPISQDEIEEWKWELYQVRLEGTYNLLSIAHILQVIERVCRLEYFINHRDIEPIYPEYI